MAPRLTRVSCRLRGEQHRAGERSDGVRPYRDFGVGHLALTALASDLARRLDAEVGAMSPPDVARPAVGVDWERAAETGVALSHEVRRFTEATQPECLEPLERDDREPVVELRAVHVGRRQISTRPEQLRAMDR